MYFSGWAMDENAINHMYSSEFDICMFSNYNPISNINDEEFCPYSEIYIVAWSLGVWVAANTLNKTNLNIVKAIAINGTLNPIHELKGIAPAIFQTTITGWNEKNRSRFNMRVMGGLAQYKTSLNKLGAQSIEDQKSELEYLQQTIHSNKDQIFNFNCAVIGKNDLIFTTENQNNFWIGKTRIVEKEIPHYPFSDFNNWNLLLEL